MTSFFDLGLLPLCQILEDTLIHGAICVGETCKDGQKLVKRWLREQAEKSEVVKADVQFYWDNIRGNPMLIHGYNPDDPEHRALLSHRYEIPEDGTELGLLEVVLRDGGVTPIGLISPTRQLSSAMLIDWVLKSPMYFEATPMVGNGSWGNEVLGFCEVASLSTLRQFCDRHQPRFSDLCVMDSDCTWYVQYWLNGAVRNRRDSSVFEYIVNKLSQEPKKFCMAWMAWDMALGNHLDALKCLVQRFDLKSTDFIDLDDYINACPGGVGETLICSVAESCDVDVLKFLIEEVQVRLCIEPEDRYSVFYNACRSGNLAVVKYLMKCFDAPAQEVVKRGLANALGPFFGKANLDLVRFLVDRCHLTVDELFASKNGWTPMFSDAVQTARYHPDILMYFIEHFNLGIEVIQPYLSKVLVRDPEAFVKWQKPLIEHYSLSSTQSLLNELHLSIIYYD